MGPALPTAATQMTSAFWPTFAVEHKFSCRCEGGHSCRSAASTASCLPRKWGLDIKVSEILRLTAQSLPCSRHLANHQNGLVVSFSLKTLDGAV